MSNNPVELEKLLEQVNRSYSLIDDTRLYYTLKKIGVRIHIDSEAFSVVKALLAYYENKFLVVTTTMLKSVINSNYLGDYSSIVHRLGDYKVVLLLHSKYLLSTQRLRWRVHPIFLNAYYGDKNEKID